MTSSLYIVGSAGSGKSTFMGELLSDAELGPLEDIHGRKNAKALVVLRGHRARWPGLQGWYLGRMRPSFPGTDGLDRASSATGVKWLEMGGSYGENFIVGEGATLATRPFLEALQDQTELMLLHLVIARESLAARFQQRGSSQKESFVEATRTRSRNVFEHIRSRGPVEALEVGEDPAEWELASRRARLWLEGL